MAASRSARIATVKAAKRETGGKKKGENIAASTNTGGAPQQVVWDHPLNRRTGIVVITSTGTKIGHDIHGGSEA